MTEENDLSTTKPASPASPASLDDYPVRIPIPVRWSDIDMYGHVNNATYYEWFDSAINLWLLAEAGAVPEDADVVGVVGESACTFESQVRFGDEVTVGISVAAIGSSSVTYALAILVAPDERRAALGHWVHVYVQRGGGTAPIPGTIAAALASAKAQCEPARLRKLPLRGSA